jgi:hypothetical protein
MIKNQQRPVGLYKRWRINIKIKIKNINIGCRHVKSRSHQPSLCIHGMTSSLPRHNFKVSGAEFKYHTPVTNDTVQIITLQAIYVSQPPPAMQTSSSRPVMGITQCTRWQTFNSTTYIFRNWVSFPGGGESALGANAQPGSRSRDWSGLQQRGRHTDSGPRPWIFWDIPERLFQQLHPLSLSALQRSGASH